VGFFFEAALELPPLWHTQWMLTCVQLVCCGSTHARPEQVRRVSLPQFTNEMNMRKWAIAACVGVIFFSSTSIAGRWSDHAFDSSWVLLAELTPYAPAYTLTHLLAEKSVHFVLFCIFGMLLWRTLPKRTGKIWLILVCGAAVGSCSEILQSCFPQRDPLITDVLINISGTAIGIALSRNRRELPE
jgi:VanZ family protein